MNARKLVLTLALICCAASAQAQVFTTFLSGPNENPPNASPGTGSATLTLDMVNHTFQLVVNFSGLTGTVTASHIHTPVTMPGGTAGVATQTPSFTGFPLGVTSGSYNMTFDMTMASTWNPAFITANGGTAAGAEAAFVSGVQNGNAYLNIHTSTFAGGEIRGFFAPVPEPATVSLLGVAGGLGLLGAWRARRRA